MSTCVHSTGPASPGEVVIRDPHVPVCACLLKAILGYDMSRKDEERVKAFEECAVTVDSINENRAVSMRLKDLKRLLDAEEWTVGARPGDKGPENGEHDHAKEPLDPGEGNTKIAHGTECGIFFGAGRGVGSVYCAANICPDPSIQKKRVKFLEAMGATVPHRLPHFFTKIIWSGPISV